MTNASTDSSNASTFLGPAWYSIDELFDELPLTGGLEKQYCFAIEQVFYELRYVKDEDDMNIVISCDYVDQDTYLDFLISQRK